MAKKNGSACFQKNRDGYEDHHGNRNQQKYKRNKHIQRVLIEAAKLATRESPELAMIRAKELEKGNPNRATLAVARKMVIYMLAVERRQQGWVPAEQFSCRAAA